MPNSIHCQELASDRNPALETVGFGGGCHWCTEAVFNALRGVVNVEQGFIKSEPPTDVYSEAVRIMFDSGSIPLAVLLEVHLRTHGSTSNHTFRTKYRSAIYTFNEIQAVQANEALQLLQRDFDGKLVTQVLPFKQFKLSDERYHQYYENNAGGEFCTRFIDPKLDLLREQYGDFLIDSQTTHSQRDSKS